MAIFNNLFQNNKKNIDILKRSTLKELTFHLPNLTSKGMHGEENILAELRKSKIPMWVLHDVYLSGDASDKGTQFDFIIVTPYFISIVESKYVSSDILITDSGYKINGEFRNRNYAWDQVNYQKKILTNILKNSNMRHKLNSLLPDIIQTYVVYSNTDCQVTNNCETPIMHNNILHISSFISNLENLASSVNPQLDNESCNDVAHAILQKHNEDKLIEFYKDIQKKTSNKETVVNYPSPKGNGLVTAQS